VANLYLDRKDAEIEEKGGALLVREPDGSVRGIPLSLVENLVVAANIRCSSNTIVRCANAGTTIVFLNRRNPVNSVIASVAGAPNARRRMAQMRAAVDDGWKNRWSRRLVETKLQLSAAFLREAARERPDRRYDLMRAATRVESALAGLRLVDLIGPSELMGLEGSAAAAYFEAYCRLFAPALECTGRNRRPPRDPVNACLSLGYTIVHAEAARAAAMCGFDPLIGFYHEPHHSRESFACDLVETERASVDRWVWHAFRDRRLRPEHFRRQPGVCLLGKAGRKIFYEDFETVRAASQARFLRRCRHFARVLERRPER
jgi:CRISPR-associated protein Cas1